LLDLGLAQVSAGEREAARNTLQLAADKARELGAADELAQVALSLAPGLFAIETGVYDPVLVELLREALDQVGGTNRRLRALLLGRLALALYWSDTFDERLRLCEEARKLADELGAIDVLAAVTTARAFALLRPSNLDERRTLAETASGFSRRAGDNQLLMLNHVLLGAAALERGDFAAATFEANAFRTLAMGTRQPQSLWIVEAQRASRLLMDGLLDEVEALAGGCLFVGQRVHDHNALLTFGVHLTLVRIEQGRTEEVLAAIRDYAARYPLIVGWRVLLAHALSCADKKDEARAEYESLKSRGFSLPDDLNWMVSMAWLAELCHAFGDAEAAAVLYERFAPYSDRLVVIGYAGIACLGSVQRYLGLLAETAERLDAARRHFEKAVERDRQAMAALPLAHSLAGFGAFLARIGADAEARKHLSEAESLACSRNLTALVRIIRTP
jgi:tetratricopeptide (TPR) repeat protein